MNPQKEYWVAESPQELIRLFKHLQERGVVWSSDAPLREKGNRRTCENFQACCDHITESGKVIITILLKNDKCGYGHPCHWHKENILNRVPGGSRSPVLGVEEATTRMFA